MVSKKSIRRLRLLMDKVGITSVGAYVPYYYISRETIGKAWGGKGGKGVRSMMNEDEDSVTMAVEAARKCLKFVGREQITGLIFASTTAPYQEKSHAGIVSAACDFPREIFTTDLGGSLKNGTSAVKMAASIAAEDENAEMMVVAADCRNAMPKTAKEPMLGDAAAALVIGHKNVIATLDCFCTVSDEIVDVWRNEGEKFVNWGEGRFILDKGYSNSLSKAIKMVFEKTGLSAADFTKVILPAPDLREYQRVAKKLGFQPDQVQDPLLNDVGDSGTAQVLLTLVYALESASAGDRLLVANYGNGADAMVLTVTDEIGKIRNEKMVHTLLSTRKEFPDYSRFLAFRRIAPTTESRYNLKPSNAKTWREQDTFIRFKGCKCKKCGAENFPANRVCYKCGSVDEFELVNCADRLTKVFTFTLDELAGTANAPVVGQVCADDEFGVRYYNIMTDFDPKEVALGMPLEFTFRRMNELGNFKNYYWKFKPVRTATEEGGEEK
jgi:hydroxymethylglutaryl-CoA synthase